MFKKNNPKEAAATQPESMRGDNQTPLDKIRGKILERIPALKRYNTAINTSIILSGACLALSLSNMMLISEVNKRLITQIVTPPNFVEEISMRGNQVSESYQTAWSVFVAEKIGNISASRMELTTQIIRKMIPEQAWDIVNKEMKQQLNRLQIRKIEEKFGATDVSFDPKTKIVWVTGEKETTSIRTGKTSSELWTFEIKIVAQNGFPKIVHLQQYAGSPNTRTRSKDIQRDGENMNPEQAPKGDIVVN